MIVKFPISAGNSAMNSVGGLDCVELCCGAGLELWDCCGDTLDITGGLLCTDGGGGGLIDVGGTTLWFWPSDPVGDIGVHC